MDDNHFFFVRNFVVFYIECDDAARGAGNVLKRALGGVRRAMSAVVATVKCVAARTSSGHHRLDLFRRHFRDTGPVEGGACRRQRQRGCCWRLLVSLLPDC